MTGGSADRTIARRDRRGLHPMLFESLESRRLFSVVLTLNGGVLQVSEDFAGAADSVQFAANNGQLTVSVDSGMILGNNALFNAGWTITGGPDVATGPETGISSIQIDLGNGTDVVSIPSMNLPVLIQPSGAADEILRIGGGLSGNSAQAITQPITFDATAAHSASISIDDELNTGNADATFTSSSIAGFAGAAINFSVPSASHAILIDALTTTGTSDIIIDQDPNDSSAIAWQIDGFSQGQIGAEHLNANSQLTIESHNGGSEEVRLGSAGIISGLLGHIDIQGNSGSASLFVNDSNDTAAHTFAAVSSGPILSFTEDGVLLADMGEPCTAFTLETGTAANTVNLDLLAGSTRFVATVECGGVNDTVNVSNLASTSQLNLIGGAGIDHVSLIAVSVQGAVNISNPIGSDAVVIDGTNTFSSEVISVSDSRVLGFGSGTYSLANASSLSVIGGPEFDDFNVTPSATVSISLDGGPTTGASNDRMEVSTSQATGVALSLQSSGANETGTFTFTNRQPVNFTQFGTITPTFGDVTGTVYDEQTATVVAGATVVVDENNNGVADAGEPTTTTDAGGAFAFQGLPTGTFALLAQVSGLQNLSTTSVTVSAGVLATPVLVPLVPVARPGGPDLVATVIATATGKSGSIKPKARVTMSNAGASMAAAAALQIVLVASADNVLDSASKQLLTFTTPPVLLKTKKSKTFILTGSTLASLVKGNYFVLASVDAGNAVGESDETNNVVAASKAVLLAPPAVDLTGKFGKLPKTASKSKVLPVSFLLQNLGTIPANGTIDFDFFVSADKALDNADVPLGTGFPVAAHMAAGKSQTAKFKLSINSALPASSYYLVAKINSTSSIAESDSTNNTIFSVTPIAIS